MYLEYICIVFVEATVKYVKYIFKIYLCYFLKCIWIVSFFYQSLYLDYICTVFNRSWCSDTTTRNPGPLMADNDHIKHTDLGVCFALRPAIFEIHGYWKSEKHQMAPELLEAFNFNSILYTLNTHPWGPNLTLFNSTTSHFQHTRLLKMHPMTQNGLKHLTVESILYIPNAYPQNSLRFALQPAIFEIQGCQKLEMHQLSKVPCIHWIFTPKAQISIYFTLRPDIFKIQVCWKLEMHRMTPEWP